MHFAMPNAAGDRPRQSATIRRGAGTVVAPMTPVDRLRAAALRLVAAGEAADAACAPGVGAEAHRAALDDWEDACLSTAPALATAVLALLDGHWLGDCGDPECEAHQALAAAAAMLPDGGA